MFEGYVSNVRRTRSSTLKDSSMMASTVVASMAFQLDNAGSLRPSDPLWGHLSWHWPHAGHFDTVLGLLTSRLAAVRQWGSRQ